MKYIVDIELSGMLCIEAEGEAQALTIAENLGIDQLRDNLLYTKTTLIERLTENTEANRVFSLDDI